MPNFLVDEDTELLAAEFVLGTLDAEERANAHVLLLSDHAFIAMVRIWERRLSELHLMVEPVEPDPKIFERIKARLDKAPPGELPLIPAPGRPAKLTEPLSGLLSPASPSGNAADTVGLGPDTSPRDLEAFAVKPGEDGQPIPELRLPEAVVRSAATTPPPKLPDNVADRRPGVPASVAAKLRRSRGRWRFLSMLLFLVIAASAGLVAAWKFVPEQVPPPLQLSQLMSYFGIPTPSAPVQPARPTPPADAFDE